MREIKYVHATQNNSLLTTTRQANIMELKQPLQQIVQRVEEMVQMICDDFKRKLRNRKLSVLSKNPTFVYMQSEKT